jgi:HlyD family secretion protein
LPKRPKGRLFVGTVLFACFAFASFQIWQTFFRYQAHGTIAGRVISIHPPWDAVLSEVHVQEGERVRQGQLLATVGNVELRQRAAQLAQDLLTARATLAAERSRLRWQTGRNVDEYQEAVAEYYQAWGKLLQEKARLRDFELDFTRVTKLFGSAVASREELDEVSLTFQGQKALVEKLSSGLIELKKRIDLGSTAVEDSAPQLEPFAARIKEIEVEIELVEQRLAEGYVRSSTDGLVVRRSCYAGEYCPATEPILSIVERGSLEIVLYVRQSDVDLFTPGSELEITVDPYPSPVRCRVARLGDAFVEAPAPIQRYYHENESLLPVYLTPLAEYLQWMALRVGGVVQLPLSRTHFQRWNSGREAK